MNYRLIVVSFVLSTILLISCKRNDWYEEKVNKSQSIPKTLDDMKLLMANADILNTITPCFGEWASDGHFADESILSFLGANPVNAYTWSHDAPYVSVSEWGARDYGAYVRIFYCNLVLEQLEKIKPVTEEEMVEWRDIKGQALFVRGRTFYEIAQIFAPQYSVSSLKSLGVPLRLDSDLNLVSQRSTVEKTYNQILDDLLTAKILLRDEFPTTPYLKTKPTKISADAFLSRVYLNIENYELSVKHADSCLSKFNNLIDFNTLNADDILPFQIFNQEVIYHTTMALDINPQHFFVDEELYNQYSDNDLRKKLYFDTSSGRQQIRFKGTYDGYGGYCFSGLATDEIFLNRAEAYVRIGKIDLALKDVNRLLQSRWNSAVPFQSISANSSDELLEIIISERKKELFFRGLRWSDLRRLNLDERFAITLHRNYAGMQFLLEPNSYKYTFPIPDDVIRISGMDQNPGW